MESGRTAPDAVRNIINKFSIAFIKNMPSHDIFYINTDMNKMQVNMNNAYEKFKAMMKKKSDK